MSPPSIPLISLTHFANVQDTENTRLLLNCGRHVLFPKVETQSQSKSLLWSHVETRCIPMCSRIAGLESIHKCLLVLLAEMAQKGKSCLRPRFSINVTQA